MVPLRAVPTLALGRISVVPRRVGDAVVSQAVVDTHRHRHPHAPPHTHTHAHTHAHTHICSELNALMAFCFVFFLFCMIEMYYNTRFFMAPHLVKSWSAYKSLQILKIKYKNDCWHSKTRSKRIKGSDL